MIEFVTRGHRKSVMSGLYYHSTCGEYALYKSDRFLGDKLTNAKWLVFRLSGNGTPAGVAYYPTSKGRHPSRKSAERFCNMFDKSRSRR
jgi:hypothetical protein